MSDHEELLSRPAAARYLGISSARLSQLTAAGRLGKQIAGEYWVFTQAELDAYKTDRAQRPRGGRPKQRSLRVEHDHSTGRLT